MQLLRHRIAFTVDEADHPRALQHAEVHGEIGRVKNRSGVLVATIRFVEVVAANRAALVEEEPYAHPADPQRFGRGLGDVLEDVAQLPVAGDPGLCETKSGFCLLYTSP